MDDEESVGGASEDDVVVVGRSEKVKGKQTIKGKRRARESLGASVALGREELSRQADEILRDKENIHVRRVRDFLFLIFCYIADQIN